PPPTDQEPPPVVRRPTGGRRTSRSILDRGNAGRTQGRSPGDQEQHDPEPTAGRIGSGCDLDAVADQQRRKSEDGPEQQTRDDREPAMEEMRDAKEDGSGDHSG